MNKPAKKTVTPLLSADLATPLLPRFCRCPRKPLFTAVTAVLPDCYFPTGNNPPPLYEGRGTRVCNHERIEHV